MGNWSRYGETDFGYQKGNLVDMPLSLSHMAEDIFASMINHTREPFLELTGLKAIADPVFVHAVPELATCEVGFEPVCGRAFDGASRVDVIVRLRPGVATAFELKVGTTRVTKTRVDDEWLRPCVPSHADRRWRGNVMAVLERRFDGVSVETLRVRSHTERLALIQPWFFVARRCVLRAWKHNPPRFSAAVRQIAFEDVVDAFGNEETFNGLVRGMLAINYYKEWIARDPDAG
jgi:hypothetical protein